MDVRHEAFGFADPPFFDEQRETSTAADDLAAGLPTPGPMWTVGTRGIRRFRHPEGVDLREQGWKVQASTGMDNADRVLAAVHDYCVDRRVAFKHLRSRAILLARNSKYVPRDGSGKLVTVYPVDTVELERVLHDLSERLDGEHGAYVLSDLRYGSGPLYVRDPQTRRDTRARPA